ncbi:MAG: hypothetical protein KME64_42935 [Scytonematopsis contorta HA4267-MV1]|jgi:WD40 repeat protein|nr:hypothetical protein [Scytonematopsis contorta HA4267-MV1]
MNLINLDLLFSTISGVIDPNAFIKDKLKRSEVVIQLLKQFNLDPEQPPGDFAGVYAYALVEYGVGKPKPVLELFRQEVVKLAFRKAFDHNNPSILLSEIDAFVETYALGDDIKALGIDIKREMAAFYIVFSEVAKRTRNPADTLMSQQIVSLHKLIVNIQEQLERQPTLEGIRTEIARLATQNYPTLPGTEIKNENQCKAIALAQQIRGWFETLGYRFEQYEVWEDFYFEWIINVPVRRYRDAQKRGIERPRLPLVITLRDYAKALNVESVLAGFFFTQHNIRLNSEVFDQLNRMGKLLLIFDGFDEMAAKVDRQQMINNFWELAKVVVPGAKVILTCRTEHFPEAREGRALLNAELKASTFNLTGETPQFEVLELEKFNDEQIRQVLSFQAEVETVDRVMSNPQLLDLARRPVMTELILEALPDIEAGKPVDMSRVYLYAVQRKMQRDIKQERTFTSLAEKLYFLCELSWEMLSSERMSLNYRLFPDRIRHLFGSVVQEEKDLDHWQYDMMGQTMLIRNADGDYTPAHRSLLEFFVAYKFAAELGALAPDFMELAKARLCLDDTIPQNYTWSDYFSGNADAPLGKFIREPLEKLRETFGRLPLTKAVIDLMKAMLGESQYLINAIEVTRGKSEDEVGYVGGNAATVAIKLDSTALEGKDLSCAVIKGGDFSDSSLIDVNFMEANLANSSFTKVFSTVLSVAFSPNGKFLATADSDGVIILWDAFTGREIMTLNGHNDWVNVVTFSPESDILASGSADKQVKLWDIYTGKCIRSLSGNTTNILSAVFIIDGNILVTGSYDNAVKIWDVKTGECLNIWQGHEERVRSVAFNNYSKILATGSFDKTIRLWDINTGECLKILQEHSAGILSLAFSPSGEILASGSSDKTAKLWNISTGKCLKTLEGHGDWVRSVAFSSCGEILASGSSDQTVRIWNVSTGECVKTLAEHTAWVRSVAFNPKNNIIASGSYDKTVKLWDVNTGECVTTLLGYSNWINSIAFSPNGETFITGSYDQRVRVWNSHTGECLKTLQGHSGFVMSVSFNSAGSIIASGSSDKTVKLWDAYTGKCLRTLQLNGHKDWINSIAFSPIDEIVISSSGDRNIKIWDIPTGKCLKTLEGHSKQVFSIAISPDGKLLASGSGDKTIRLWNIDTGECVKILLEHTSYIYSIAFTRDSYTLVSGSEDSTVKLWDIATGKCLRTLQHGGRVRSVTFNYDDTQLVSGCDDQMVKIWDTKTGNCLKTFSGHSSVVCAVASSSNGSIIASGSRDETIKLWNIKTGKCLKTLRGERPYARMNIKNIKGLSASEIATLKTLGAHS